jgi:hypothetical protein
MAIEIVCPSCDSALLAEPGRLSCPACGQLMDVQSAEIQTVSKELSEPVVRYLRGLLFDGELSGDEVWCLASWLNKQPKDICGAWPANILIPLLQNVFEDGEVTVEEMRAIAEALVQIEQEWLTRFALKEENFDEIPQSDQSPTSGSPSLPVVSYVGNVESSSGAGEYEVNLANHSCTCPDWVGKRRSTPAQDYRRLCKHMAQLFHTLELGTETSDLAFEAFIIDHASRGKGTFPRDEWTVETVNGKRVLYGHSPGAPWVNVFAPRGDSYERFGFNKDEKRWSYGESPYGFAKFFREKFRNVS